LRGNPLVAHTAYPFIMLLQKLAYLGISPEPESDDDEESEGGLSRH